ncbi:MAG: fibronectin type III domain-containing protein [Treponema sp.]|jgi:hypothetical protein|nr:fibronectin type III domain-containing protein [Treponema sp.]
MSKKCLGTKLSLYLLPVFLISAVLLTGCSDPTNPALPAKPIITSVISAGATSLKVTWGAVPGADSYEVCYYDITTEMLKTVPNSTGTSATITSLTNGTPYHVWVRARNVSGESEYSEPLTGVPFDLVPLEDLKGSWVSGWGEEFTITSTEFISAWGGATSYRGPIVNVRTDTGGDSDAGYITIRYTENTSFSDAVGNYYVIRWEDLTAASDIKLSGAFNDENGGKGYTVITDAETNYAGTIGAKPFQYPSDCYLTAVASRHSAIEGSWEETTSGDSYTITDKLVIYANSGFPMFVGEIVNVRTLDNDENYITFRYITNGVDGDLIGTYCVLYWTNFTANVSADIATACEDTPGDVGETTQSAAETEYTIINVSGYFSDLNQFEPPSY